MKIEVGKQYVDDDAEVWKCICDLSMGPNETKAYVVCQKAREPYELQAFSVCGGMSYCEQYALHKEVPETVEAWGLIYNGWLYNVFVEEQDAISARRGCPAAKVVRLVLASNS